ncbi:MAG TPA: hypothetical protein VKV26_10435 [Dehalococcoidia bacterium]|nr:hypothetical protein [Dehalococcoidia bacterium]
MSTNEQRQLTAQALDLYERFGKPLEAEHSGEYVSIAPDGRVALAPTLHATMVDGAARFGPGNYVFKVGDLVAGKWR